VNKRKISANAFVGYDDEKDARDADVDARREAAPLAKRTRRKRRKENSGGKEKKNTHGRRRVQGTAGGFPLMREEIEGTLERLIKVKVNRDQGRADQKRLVRPLRGEKDIS